MFSYPEFDKNGIKTLCEMGKIQPEMNMTIRIKRFKGNESFASFDEKCETAFLLFREQPAFCLLPEHFALYGAFSYWMHS